MTGVQTCALPIYQRVDRDYFVEALRGEFGDNAETQVDIAVEWGRYAELFDYDTGSDELSLEA